MGDDCQVTGQLILAATPIGNSADSSLRLREALTNAQVIAAEDSRRAKRLIQDLEINTNAQIWSFYDAVEDVKSPELIDRVIAGDTVVVISDAGMPTVSDPGYRIVQEAIAKGVKVSVIPGPSAVLTALAISGLAVDRFSFEGFLPRKSGERKKFLEELSGDTRTMVFFEAPHRLRESLEDFAQVFGLDRQAVICRELTKTYEEIIRGNFAELLSWADREILGEITLVVAGSPAILETTAEDWVNQVATRVKLGVSQRDAIAEVAKELRVPKRDVYDAVLASKE
ncbi:MAG: rRNA ((1402)-2-O)-methyltransferase [Actinomycetota bacterium]|jgi:16S rRNA (cytidine1402-2'-O)-methyltransferase